MNDWSAIETATRSLGTLPERFSMFLAPPGRSLPSRDELARALEIAREGLVSLGAVSEGEPSASDHQSLPTLKYDFVKETRDRRAVTSERLRRFLVTRGEFRDLPTVSDAGVARFIMRALLGTLTVDVMGVVPGAQVPDPEDLRSLALEWFEEHALLLSEAAQCGCFWALGPCVGHRLIPIATRLYHDPNTGPHFAETMEEIFGPEVFEQIRAEG